MNVVTTTAASGPCSHCMAYINRSEFSSNIIRENEYSLETLYNYSPHLGCLMTAHPMRIEAAIDSALEYGDLDNYAAHTIMLTVMHLHEEVFFRSTPTTADELDLYSHIGDFLSKKKITSGNYEKLAYHMPQDLINKARSCYGDNSEYYYGLVMDCVEYYEKQLEL